jgi:hypothetical protein
MPSPNAANSTNNRLRGVDALASNDVWAVGYYSDSTSFKTLAMHWDGVNWTITPTPNPLPTSDQLKKVDAIAPNDVWAVGGHGQSYTLRWNGSEWSRVPLPPITNRGFTNVTNFLEDIAAVSSNDIWLVGAVDALNGGTWTLTVHWDGTRWTQIPSPNVTGPNGNVYSQGLDAVVALASDNVWAVGYYRVGNTQHTLIMHWDGTQWSIVPSPNGPTGDGWLHGIAAAGPNDIWAVGEYNKLNFNNPAKALTLHWDGNSWTAVVPPNPSPYGINPLQSVVARGPNDFFAVGEWQNESQGLNTYVLHWNGSAWTQVPSENMPGSGTGWNQLADVARDASGGLWTVGVKQASFGSGNYTLVARSPVTTTPVVVASVVSTKSHGGQPYSIDLPLTGAIGVEGRSGGANGLHTIVFAFGQPLASVGGATVEGSGSVSSSAIDPADPHRYVVNLNGIENQRRITIRLTDVTDTAGNQSATVAAPMGVLLGDVNGNGFVNASDVGVVKGQSGQPVSGANFRSDVTANGGSINASDLGAVKSGSGTQLPP